ncbi:MAG: dTDP-4-dehydrorhamnose reductase [Chloroflexi bacterium]|nr:dTDP-4-dehydrorhamnose reductase [Chloroflexota bacterium]
MRARILLTGGTGQLGSEIRRLLTAGPEPAGGLRLVAPARAELDLAEPGAVGRFLDDSEPELVLHAGAYTAVERAESEAGLAFRVNRDGTAAIASWCARRRVPLLYVSTDFVFDGQPPPGRDPAAWRAEGYEPEDTPHPLNVYGASKLAGEEAVRASGAPAWILRTSWVFGVRGANFPNSILRAAAAARLLRVVDDQWGRPTFARDLARVVLGVAGLLPGRGPAPYGTLHAANAGVTSWYAFAWEILGRAGWEVAVEPIASADYPSKARRPAFSALSTCSIEALGLGMRPWQEALEEFLAELRVTEPELFPRGRGTS